MNVVRGDREKQHGNSGGPSVPAQDVGSWPLRLNALGACVLFGSCEWPGVVLCLKSSFRTSC